MKFCIIGLGRFGQQLAKSLAEHQAEVLAIDTNEHEIAAVQNYVTQAICTEITDAASLEAIGIEEIDVAIIAIGENVAQAILIAAIIKKRFKHVKVIARATSQTQKEILNLLKVDDVIRPEQEAAINLADTLSSPFKNLARLSKTFSIGLIQVPEDFVSKTVKEFDLYNNYKVNCIAVKRDKEFISINENYTLLDYDELIVSGKNEDIAAFDRDKSK
ncbi:MAG: TrkA family potassium uptake protein [Candidatus Dependentiae bacterium]|jgi:trk system potassium uptake protein TrkA|nr:TrkA family potassium uptake protein [Candidatus Dependentiae bacterium]